MTVGERGATLAEVLVAIALVAVGLVGVAIVLPASSAGVHEGGQLSTATFLAEQMIERARAAAWSADPPVDCLGVSAGDAAPLPDAAGCRGRTQSPFPDEDDVPGYAGYRRQVRVTGCQTPAGCAGLAGDGLRRVTVTVRYTPAATGGAAPAPRDVRLEWLATRR